MAASHSVVSDQVILQCPACGACESTDAFVVADSPMIVCRDCGETWPAAPRRRKRQHPIFAVVEEETKPETLSAERRPLVSYSDGADKAWAAKVEGDFWPEPPRRSRLPAAAAAMAAVFFMASFLGGREAAVAALPDLAGLYAAIGLPVNLDALSIGEVAALRMTEGGKARVTVRGTIRNPGRMQQTVPLLAADLHDSARITAVSGVFDPPARVISAGESLPFKLEFNDVPSQAVEVVVRFRRPGDRVREAHEAVAAAQ
ncbi:MAG TPA: DUF3426 domain-containing protein [Propylenella sp.]